MKSMARMVATITILGLLHLLPVCVQAQTVEYKGLTDAFDVYGCLAGGSSTAELPNKKVFVRTGWQAFDNAVVEDIKKLDQWFGVNVQVYFLNDDSEMAFFAPVKFRDLMREDRVDPNTIVSGSVFLSVALIRNEYIQNNNQGYTIAAILGHEFAHAMQYKKEFPLEGKRRELHADYMAGWFTACRGFYYLQNPYQSWYSISKRGDYDFYGEGHHGTPQERAEAFRQGYNLFAIGKQSSGVQAYNAGFNYVKRL